MVSQETYDVLWHDYCLFRAQIFSITSISLLICAKKFQVTPSSWCHVTFNQCSFHQMKLNISMTSLLTFGTCLMMLYLLVHFLDFLWMTSILFDVNMYCRFFSISKLVNWVIIDLVVHKHIVRLAIWHHLFLEFWVVNT